ncbi:MAG: NAD(P)H-quinone oxidoreductase, partial [Alphaproteobacteria bacterium]|nr:NAD(P)H-quinone oxidoreductase [Alphaproteobacteria bacterium]
MSELPKTMDVMEITEFGPPENLKKGERPVEPPKEGELVIKVAAAGVNKPDTFQRTGNYPPPPGASDIAGLEVAGTVAALGKGVSDFKLGDEVCALLAGGGYAHYATVNAQQVLPVPKGLSMVEAASLPETFFTVWTNVFDRGALKKGERFLVHGGSSGIGTSAIMLAHALGAEVYATAGTPEKCQACLDLGAKRAINYKSEDYAAVLKEELGPNCIDVVLDMVGGDYIARDMDIMAEEGRHVSIAFLGGPKAQIPIPPLMLKRLTLTGSTLRPRPASF